jgi:pimeloyl-ACP methyl ester carboxylesterase
MRTIAAAIANAEFAEIPDAGHMTTMENPAAVNNALVRFIDARASDWSLQ